MDELTLALRRPARIRGRAGRPRRSRGRPSRPRRPNSTTIARISDTSVHAAWTHVGRPEDGLAGEHPGRLVADQHEPAALDDDEPGRCSGWRAARGAPSGEGQLGDRAAGVGVDRPAARTPIGCRPGPRAAGGRRRSGGSRCRWSGRYRRRRRLAASAGPARARRSGRFDRIVASGWANFDRREVALAGELPLVGLEHRREADEPDPDEDRRCRRSS